MKTKAEWGAKIEQLRTESGLTRYGLSKKSGVSLSTITFIEEGRNSPSLETIEKLLDAMDVELVIQKK